MARKGAKMALTYVITLISTFVVLGFVAWYIMNNYLGDGNKKNQAAETLPIEQLVDTSTDFVPTAADNRTVLFILDTEKRETASCFMLVRFLAVDKQVVLLPLPSTTSAIVNGTEKSLYEFYRNGGASAAKAAIENCTGIKADNYMTLSQDGFSALIDIFGGVDYNIPYNLVYSNETTGEETVIRQGATYLDSQTMRKVFTYPNYNSGEEYRAKCTGVIICDLLNENVDDSFDAHLDEYFNNVINSDIETDITSYDYEEVSPAMKYVIRNTDKLCVFVPASGTTQNELFTLDEYFVKSLTEWFKLYEIEETTTTASETTVTDKE